MAFNNSSCHYQEGLKVLFDGSKNFWRTRTSIDVVVALHTIHNCIEIVAFNPTLFLKAPRIYANFSTLKSHLDPVAINESLNQMKETATRLKKLFNLKDATTQILSELSLEYIFKRLDFARDCTRENFRMELKVFSGDHSIDVDGQSALDCVITCPQLLIPVTVDHKAKLRIANIEKLLKQLNNDSMELHQATRSAELIINSTDGFKVVLAEQKKRLMKGSAARQRWRMACHRVIIQNFVQRARERLLRSDLANWYLEQQHHADEEKGQPAPEEVLTDTEIITPPRVTDAHSHRPKKDDCVRRCRVQCENSPVALALSRVKHVDHSEDGSRTERSKDERLHSGRSHESGTAHRGGIKLPTIGTEGKGAGQKPPSDASFMERERSRQQRSFRRRNLLLKKYHTDIQHDPFFLRENERKRKLGQNAHPTREAAAAALASADASKNVPPPAPPSLLKEFTHSIVRLDQCVPLEAFKDPDSIFRNHRHRKVPSRRHQHGTKHFAPELQKECSLPDIYHD